MTLPPDANGTYPIMAAAALGPPFFSEPGQTPNRSGLAGAHFGSCNPGRWVATTTCGPVTIPGCERSHMDPSPLHATQLHGWLERLHAGDLQARDELLRGVGDRLERPAQIGRAH